MPCPCQGIYDNVEFLRWKRIRRTGIPETMTIHEALWFIDQVRGKHPEKPERPRHRFTRSCLYQNVHPNQEAFMTLEGKPVQEGSFAGRFSELKKRKCIDLIYRDRTPADAWVLITPFGEETLKLFGKQCPNHHFGGSDEWSRRPRDQRCTLLTAPSPHSDLRCFCDR